MAARITILLAFLLNGIAYAQSDTLFITDTLVIFDTIEDQAYRAFVQAREARLRHLEGLEVTHLAYQTQDLDWVIAAAETAPDFSWAKRRVAHWQRWWYQERRALSLLKRAWEKEQGPSWQPDLWGITLRYSQGFYRLPHTYDNITQPWWNEYVGQVLARRYMGESKMFLTTGVGVGYRSNRGFYEVETATTALTTEESGWLQYSNQLDPFLRWHYFTEVPLAVGYAHSMIEIEGGITWQYRITRQRAHTWAQHSGVAYLSLQTEIGAMMIGLRGYADISPYWDTQVPVVQASGETQITGVKTHRQGVAVVASYNF